MPLPPTTLTLPRTLAREEVYVRLRDWIVRGVLPPSETLRDQDIAARLGVSRTPVREALRRLEDEGFVETALNRWTRVAPLDLACTAELYPLIEALEVLALETAAPSFGDQDLQHLEHANEDLRQALEQRDAVRAVAADEAFHDIWVAQAGNRELIAVLGQLKLKLRRVELAYFDAKARAQPSLVEHTAILEALRGQRWGEATKTLRQNWRGSLTRLHPQQVP